MEREELFLAIPWAKAWLLPPVRSALASFLHVELYLCLSHSKSISLRQSLEEWGLADRMVSRALGCTLREMPRSFHLPVRSTT